jgi:hypothetical protein
MGCSQPPRHRGGALAPITASTSGEDAVGQKREAVPVPTLYDVRTPRPRRRRRQPPIRVVAEGRPHQAPIPERPTAR